VNEKNWVGLAICAYAVNADPDKLELLLPTIKMPCQLLLSGSHEIARAIMNAAAAASPPMSTVWLALRSGGAPVK